MSTNHRQTFGRISGAVAFAAALVATFSLQPAVADSQDPGVLRISTLDGTAAIKHGDSGDTVDAAVNAPLMVGDYLSTDANSRAEVQFDYGDFLRAGSGVQLRVSQLDANNEIVQLAAGTVVLSVLRDKGTYPEIDTPSIGIRPSEAGRYRITVNNDGNTEVTVRSGRADILLAQGTQQLSPGSTLLASGSASDPQVSTTDFVAQDSFDSWNAQRDTMFRREMSQRYGETFVGASDLDSSGRWVNVPAYGYVWTPTVAAGWAPYSDGRWVWEPYYGWTWVAYEPWGWAPYHYGRWFYAANYGWCWTPGSVAVQPVWQPALVAFVGFNIGGVNVAVNYGNGYNGFGNIGWIPLAPNDPYHPWWGRGYNNNVTNVTNITNITNVTNVTNITNVYRNAAVPGALTAVSTPHFQAGQFSNRVTLKPAQIRNVQLITSTVPVVPSKQNLQYSARPLAVTTAPNPQRFHSFKTAPAPPAQTFAQERAQVQTVTQKVYARPIAPNHAVVPATAVIPQHAITVPAQQPVGHPVAVPASTVRPQTAPAPVTHTAPPAITQPATARTANPVSTNPFSRFTSRPQNAPPPVTHTAPPAATQPATVHTANPVSTTPFSRFTSQPQNAPAPVTHTAPPAVTQPATVRTANPVSTNPFSRFTSRPQSAPAPVTHTAPPAVTQPAPYATHATPPYARTAPASQGGGAPAATHVPPANPGLNRPAQPAAAPHPAQAAPPPRPAQPAPPPHPVSTQHQGGAHSPNPHASSSPK